MMKNLKFVPLIAFSILPLISGKSNASSALFHPYVTHETGSYAEAVAIGDVNGNGKNDVVVTTSAYMDRLNDNRIHVFLQNGAGKLDPHTSYIAGNGSSVDVGDISGDGKDDVVVSAENGIGVFLQLEAGRLAPMTIYPSNHESGSNAYRVRIGDFNNDGLLDVVSIDSGDASGDVDLFFQRADGTLSPPVSYTLDHGGNNDLVVGDVNSDGLSDIIVVSGGGKSHENIGVLLQNAHGGFLLPYYYDLGEEDITRAAAVGDVDGDGLFDIAVSALRAGTVASIGVLNQNDVGGLNPAVRFFPSADNTTALEIADVDLDGKNDVLVAGGEKNSLRIYTRNAGGELSPGGTFPLPHSSRYNPHGLAVGDINGDGAADIALADHNNGMVIMYNAATPELLPDIEATWSDFSVDFVDATQYAEGYLQVTNRGVRETKKFLITYFLSQDPHLDTMDSVIGIGEVPPIQPGTTIWHRFDYRSALYLQGEFVIAVIDPDNKVRESDEDNNRCLAPMVHMAKKTGDVEEYKAIVRRACPSNYCSDFIKKIKNYYR